MSNIIDSIQVSGITYTIQGSGGGSGNPTVELTQAEYDALVESGAVEQNTYYIITDATAVDISNYWTSAQTNSAITAAVSGKVDTSAVVSSVTSASTDNEIPTAKAVYDAIPTGGTGGGKAISAGTNISVTTGETADTVSCTLPIYVSTGYKSIRSDKAFVYGERNISWGNKTYVGANGASYVPDDAFAFGYNVNAYNNYEASFGKYNVSNQNTLVGGDSGTTLFSVGNGTSNSARHNAFEVRKNGDIYFTLNGNDVKLQDQLGGTVSSAITSGDTNAVAGGAVYVKLDEIEQVTARALNQLAEANEVVARALNDLNDRITAIEARLNNS